jgi:hypothetical protein
MRSPYDWSTARLSRWQEYLQCQCAQERPPSEADPKLGGFILEPPVRPATPCWDSPPRAAVR